MMASRMIFVVLAVAVLGSAIAVVYTKHQTRRLFMELQTLQDQRDRMNVDWGRLQLEQSTLETHGRIDGIARSHMGMVSPPPEAVVVVKR